MPQEPRSCISYLQPPTAVKRPNTSLDFTKTPPELPQSNANTQSLESILKGKVIKEFVPQAQKEQKASEPTKLAYETAKSKPSAPPPIPKPPMLVPAPRQPVQQQQPLHPIRQPHQQPYRQQPPIRPQPQPPRPPQFPPWNPQGHQGIPFHCIPPGAFYVPRQPLKPKIHKPIWALNNKTTHFLYDASFVTFPQTFKALGFDNLAINTLSAITLDIESDHKQTCYDFISTICLWYKTVNFM